MTNYMPAARFISERMQINILRWKGEELIPVQMVSGGAFLPEGDFLREIVSAARKDTPVFMMIGENVCVICFDSPDGVFLMGPAGLMFTEGVNGALHFYKMEGPGIVPDRMVLPPEVVRCALLLFNTVNGTDVSETECLRKNFRVDEVEENIMRKATDEQYLNRENQRKHTPYDQEMRIRQAIAEGDAEALPEIWREPVSGELGMTAKDPVRNGKNLAVVNVAIMSRAAIRGGVPAEDAMTIADSYIRQIEELKNMMILEPMIQDMQIRFANMVAEGKSAARSKGQENRTVSACKVYISHHLHEKMTVREIARAVGVHPNYLSSMFLKTEGVSMYQYILDQKLRLTKNLLRYTRQPCSEIASTLGFSSQSHLGQFFKKKTGMTMMEYRNYS